MMPHIENEIWKDIIGFEGLYQWSNLGKIKTLHKIYYTGDTHAKRVQPEKIMSPNITRGGYLGIGLRKGNKTHRFLVHRIIGMNGIPKPLGKREINHKDGVKTNNNINNLEWATRSENIQHAFDTGLKVGVSGVNGTMYGRKGINSPIRGSNHPKSKIVLDTQTGIFYDCARAAAEAKNIEYKYFSMKLCGRAKNNTSMIYV